MDMQKNLKNEINSCSQNGMGNFAQYKNNMKGFKWP